MRSDAGAPRQRHLVWLVVGLLAAGFVLRAPLSSVGPVLPQIRTDLELSSTIAGFTGTIPIIGFSVFAFATPFLVSKFGPERTFGIALAILTGALVLRSAGDATAFFLGTGLAGMGIAIANVVPPGLIRQRFPLRVATLSSMNVVVMNAGSAIGSAAAVPLMDAGLGWRGSIAAWAVPAVVALALWTVAAKAVIADDRGRRHHPASPAGMGRVARHLRPWLMAVFMGMQSTAIYFLFTWLATILQAHGMSPTVAGLLVGLVSILGIVGALVVGPLLQRGHLRVVTYTLYPLYALGLALLAFGPWPAVLGTIVCGLTQGAGFTVMLTMISQHAEPADVPATSALVQGVGYLLASASPSIAGALFDRAGTWHVPIAFVTGLMLVATVVGVVLVRNRPRPA